MSSMRNAINRRVHRERGQPQERRRLGLLEKHKDYSKRAKDYNRKKAQLRTLRSKAAERNDDEFYHGMLTRKGPGSRIQDGRSWRGTVAGDRGNRALGVDAVRLLKTQDVGYVRTMGQVVAREEARLAEQLVLTRGLDRLDDDDDDDDQDDEDDQEEEEDGEEEADSGEDEDGGKTSRKQGFELKPPRKILFFDDDVARRDAVQRIGAADREDARQERGETTGPTRRTKAPPPPPQPDHDDQDDQDEDEDTARKESIRRLRKQLHLARKKRKALADAEVALVEQRAKMAKTATSGGVTRRGRKMMVRTRKR